VPGVVAPPLSLVVVAYDMERELPRTLRSLAPDYQSGIDGAAYELIVVDNGSPRPLDADRLAAGAKRVELLRCDPASASPAPACNLGIEAARGELVGVLIDGARLASPGLLALALAARGLANRPVIATLGWHLGPETHMRAAAAGYDQEAEDALLERARWEADGYNLFAHSTLAGSSGRGWFGPLGESNALFMPAASWAELGGFDEAFSLPGGGLVNHDLFARACALDGARLIVLLGEGTFHQIHGGASTSGRYTRAEAGAEYEALRGRAYAPPQNAPTYLGGIPEQALPHLEASTRWAVNAATRREAAAPGSRAGG
jgi:Glycosyl transferase family 2